MHIITLDGLSGAGKTTQMERLEQYIMDTYGMAAYLLYEPTDFIRDTLKEYRRQPKEERDPWIETYLLTADRRHQYVHDILPIVEREKDSDIVILMDRSKYSAYAYQGEDIPLDTLIEMNSFFPDPDLALFLLCEPEEAASRIGKRGGTRSGDECLERISDLKQRFEDIAPEVGAEIVYGDGSEDATFHQLRSHVDAYFGGEMNRVVFLDKDGVLVDNSCYPKIPTDELYEDSIEALRMLKDAGYLLHMVSNQSWIGKGRMTEEEVDAVFESIQEQYAAHGIEIDGYSYCPHTTEERCACKKPGTGMFEAVCGSEYVDEYVNEDILVDIRNSYMIGDMAKDIEAGNRMGLNTILVGTGCGPEKKAGCEPDITATDIYHAAQIICRGE